MATKTHATCTDCDQEMKPGTGCDATHVKMGDGAVLARTPYAGGWGPDGFCGDCNVAEGQVHHGGCDVERCPKCGQQSIGCLDYYTQAEIAELEAEYGPDVIGL